MNQFPTFGERVRMARAALGLTQLDFARTVGASTQSVSNWECERNAPWAKEQIRVLDILAQLQSGRRRKRVSDLI